MSIRDLEFAGTLQFRESAECGSLVAPFCKQCHRIYSRQDHPDRVCWDCGGEIDWCDDEGRYPPPLGQLLKLDLEMRRQIGMNIDEAVAKACQEPTLVDALSYIAIWETERVVKQVREFDRTGVRTAGHGGAWDTCFKFHFGLVMEAFGKKQRCVGGVHIGVQSNRCECGQEWPSFP